jgi:integrase
MPKKLTVPAIANYKPGAARREIRDSLAPGLYLVIQPKPSGSKSWALRFRRPNGDPAKLTLGRVADTETTDEPVLGGALSLWQARQLANRYHSQRATGIDVIEDIKAERSRKTAAAATRSANTFGVCLREFFTDHKAKKQKTRPRRWREDAALLGLRYALGADPAVAEPELIEGSLADTWRDKPIADIDGHDIHTAVATAKRQADSRARKLHSALSALFGWLLDQRRVVANPCAGVYHPGPPEARERLLSDAEIAIFWRGCDAIGAPYGALFKLLLLTGCRLREAADMCRGEMSEDGIWTVPGSRTKNHRSYALPLPPLALKVIGSVPVIAGEAGFVFTVAGKRGLNTFSQAKRELDQAMAKIVRGRPVAPWRLHDLRRTCASGMAALGVQLPVVERVLNHISGSFGGVAGVYQRHEFSDEKREALARWAQHIENLVAGRPANVIDMAKRGRSK